MTLSNHIHSTEILCIYTYWHQSIQSVNEFTICKEKVLINSKKPQKFASITAILRKLNIMTINGRPSEGLDG